MGAPSVLFQPSLYVPVTEVRAPLVRPQDVYHPWTHDISKQALQFGQGIVFSPRRRDNDVARKVGQHFLQQRQAREVCHVATARRVQNAIEVEHENGPNGVHPRPTD